MNALARRCAAAIRRVGGEAVLVREDLREAFAASIQPRPGGWEPEGDALGVGGAEYFTIYSPCGTAGDWMTLGDCVSCHGENYRVLRRETGESRA